MRSALTYVRVASFAVLCLACRSNSSVTEGGNDAEVMSATSSLNPEKVLIDAASIVEFSSDFNTRRIESIARAAVSRVAANPPANANADSPATSSERKSDSCTFAASGNFPGIVMENETANALPDGRVIYCDKGTLRWAIVDRETPKLLLSLGMTESEIRGVNFYRIPLSQVNAFATVTQQQVAVVLVYDGLVAFAKQQGIDSSSLLAGVLAHEVGHIIDNRKRGFTNLKTSRERVLNACAARAQGLDPKSVTFKARLESCERAIAADTRAFEYSADNFAVELFSRKKYPSSIDPYAVARFFKIVGDGKYDPFDSHPDGVERSVQFERALQRVGIKETAQVKPSPVSQ